MAQKYFSSPEQVLSFRLLKLDHPQQLTSIFEESKSTHNHNIKLLILYRFCCVGGTLGKGGKAGRLAQEFM
jgi:hypothetical protein